MKRILLVMMIFGVLLGCKKAKTEAPKPTIPIPVTPQNPGFKINYQFLGSNPIQTANFYLFSVIEQTPELNTLFTNNPSFKSISATFKKRLNNCVGKNFSGTQILDSLKWDDSLKDQALSGIDKLYGDSSLNTLINQHLRPSGNFENYREFSNIVLLKRAFTEATNAVNSILAVYLGVQSPKYPLIDGPIYSQSDAGYMTKIQNTLSSISTGNTENTLFFKSSLKFSLELLALNGRNEPARFQPLESGQNQAALSKINTTKWSDFPFSVIICLGDSPNSPGDDPKLSEGAKSRIPLAVERYKNKLAPFIMFTGANVFPKGSQWHEAIQMKEYLLANYPEIPESAIIVEPYARHTTTNLRNASRLIVRYKIPIDKKVIITTSKSQVDYMLDLNTFTTRNQKELGYQPMDSLIKYSLYDIQAIPNVRSLHRDAIDPLDP